MHTHMRVNTHGQFSSAIRHKLSLALQPAVRSALHVARAKETKLRVAYQKMRWSIHGANRAATQWLFACVRKSLRSYLDNFSFSLSLPFCKLQDASNLFFSYLFLAENFLLFFPRGVERLNGSRNYFDWLPFAACILIYEICVNGYSRRFWNLQIINLHSESEKKNKIIFMKKIWLWIKFYNIKLEKLLKNLFETEKPLCR